MHPQMTGCNQCRLLPGIHEPAQTKTFQLHTLCPVLYSKFSSITCTSKTFIKLEKNIIINFICMAFRYIRFVLGLLFQLHLSEVNRNRNLSESFSVFQTHICTSFRKIKGVLGPKVIFQNFFFGPIVENQVLVQKFLRLVHRTFVAPPSLAQPFIR